MNKQKVFVTRSRVPKAIKLLEENFDVSVWNSLIKAPYLREDLRLNIASILSVTRNPPTTLKSAKPRETDAPGGQAKPREPPMRNLSGYFQGARSISLSKSPKFAR